MAKTKVKNNENEYQDELQKLDELLKNMGKKYGQGAALRADKMDEASRKISRWPTSSPQLNYVLGGGIPKGRIIEAFGPESGGKTTIGTFMGAEIQKQGGRIAIVDAENSFDLTYAETLGLDITKTVFSQPSSGEEGLGLVEDYCRSGLFSFVIVDSVAALTPQAEIDGEMGDQQMGLQARLMGKALRKITSISAKTETTVFFINQLRMKIGVMFGNPETTPGGKALPFYSSIRLDVRKAEYIKEDEDNVLGIIIKVNAKKNKTAPPFRKAEIEVVFGKGVQYEKEYLAFAVDFGFVIKAGSWYSYKEERIGQGKVNVTSFFKSNPEFFQKIKDSVDKALSGGIVVEDDVVEDVVTITETKE